MKIAFRISVDGRTSVARCSYDKLPTRAELAQQVDRCLGELNLELPAPKKVAARKKVASKTSK
jgi:hypothetical protein